MISISWDAKTYCCEDFSAIENYNIAMADTEKTWDIHHRLETHTENGELRKVPLSINDLKNMGLYYHRPASELIFLKHKDHQKLHRSLRPCTEEEKEHLRQVQKGRIISWGDKISKTRIEKGYLPATCRKVLCVETNVIYNTIKEAEMDLHISNVSLCCRKPNRTSGGYHWRYASGKYMAKKNW